MSDSTDSFTLLSSCMKPAAASRPAPPPFPAPESVHAFLPPAPTVSPLPSDMSFALLTEEPKTPGPASVTLESPPPPGCRRLRPSLALSPTAPPPPPPPSSPPSPSSRASPKSPSVEYWNKSYLPSFAATRHRPRRRSSLCHSETPDSLREDSKETAAPQTPTRPQTRVAKPQQQLPSRLTRPSFVLCAACQTRLANPARVAGRRSVSDTALTGLSDDTGLSRSLAPLSLSRTRPPSSPRYRSPSARPPHSPSHFKPFHHHHHHHHAHIKESLVGSYEESLLSGRMSAPSSPPVPFYMKLGAFGQEPSALRESLKFPKHMATAFNAVFYDYDLHETGVPGRGSPYVGAVDLERYFAVQHLRTGKVSKEAVAQARLDTPRGSKPMQKLEFPGYRIPPAGKIQIVISNPQKTAVKLFLVPYDVSALGHKQKTFIRHKVFLRETSSAAMSLFQTVHLQIARPSKTKIYLYGELRVVFHNREESRFKQDGGSLASSAGFARSCSKGGTPSNLHVETVTGGRNALRYNVPEAYGRHLEEGDGAATGGEAWKSAAVFDEDEDTDVDELSIGGASGRCDCCDGPLGDEDGAAGREDLLMRDMKAASQRSYSHAPGLL